MIVFSNRVFMMDINNKAEGKNGDQILLAVSEFSAAPSVELTNSLADGNVKKKRRRGKSKRKVTKPYSRTWQDRRYYDRSKRNNRYRKIVPAKSNAPFNNNQFLMEIHKPEPENNFQNLGTPSARTRDSSFSVDSEENYFFSLPEDEEEYLTKEFSSVYEDAQSERLSNMSKNELIQEYLLLEAKFETLHKRTERSKIKNMEDDKNDGEEDISRTESLSDRNISDSSVNSTNEQTMNEMIKRIKEQDEQICQLQKANDKLRNDMERMHQQVQATTSQDSESDSSSSSNSCSTSSRSISPIDEEILSESNNSVNGEHSMSNGIGNNHILTNGHHDPNEGPDSVFPEEV